MTTDIVADLGLAGDTPANPAAAPARLEALKSDPAWTNRLLSGDQEATTEFHSLSRQAAASATVDEADAAAAARRLGERLADPAWGKKALRGDVEANREYRELTEKAAAGGAAIDFNTAPNNAGILPDSETRLAGDVMAWLAEHHIHDPLVTPEALGRMASTPEERQRATRLKDELMTDSDFRSRYLSGDAAAGRTMLLLNVILSKPAA